MREPGIKTSEEKISGEKDITYQENDENCCIGEEKMAAQKKVTSSPQHREDMDKLKRHLT